VLNRLALALQIGFLKMNRRALIRFEIRTMLWPRLCNDYGRSSVTECAVARSRCSHSMQVGWNIPAQGDRRHADIGGPADGRFCTRHPWRS